MHAIQKNLLKLKGNRSLQKFADKLGVLPSTLHNYLHGRTPPATFIITVCKKMGCDARILLGLRKSNVTNSITKYGALKAVVESQFAELEKTLKYLEEV
jgi:transcriptional regulator with XRE-family HTH domain